MASPFSLSTTTLRWCGAAGLLISCVLLAIGVLPAEWLQSLGQFVRRIDDVTPDRLMRGRQLCWGFAAVGFIVSHFLWWHGDWWVGLYNELRAEPRLPWLPADIARWELGLALAIFVAGVLFRAWHLQDGMAYDEAYTFLNFARRPWYEAIGDYNSTNNHLLNTLLMHVSYRLWGDSEWALRLPVFVLGCLVPYAVWRWARAWGGRETGLWTAALVAIAPALIAYSTDARGYMFVTLAAVTFDAALASLDRSGPSPKRTCCLAVGAATFGLWSMPIMLYAILGTSLWYLAKGWRPSSGPHLKTRILQLATMGLATSVLVAAFYSVAYIFRGLMFLNDPIMRPDNVTNFWAAFGDSWYHALEWWTAGMVSEHIWVILVFLGLAEMSHPVRHLSRWMSPFVVVLVINVLRSAIAPPRIFLWLMPWIAFAVAVGCLRFHFISSQGKARICAGLVLLTLLGGGLFVWQEPALIDAEYREEWADVPAVIARLCQEVPADDDARHRLAAPLPTDLPSLFYLARQGRHISVEGTPQPGETLWVITARDDIIAETLEDGVVVWTNAPWQDQAYELVATFPTLRLYRSRTTFQPSVDRTTR